MPSAQLLAVALITLFAVITDLKFNKIPNVLVLAGLLGGFALQTSSLGLLEGSLNWVGGMITAGLVLLPFYVMGGMAAGDVKLIAAVGCIVGWPLSVVAGALTLISGSVLALIYCAMRGGLKELMHRFSVGFKSFITTGKVFLPKAEEGSVARSRFPYALAIAAGGIWASLL